MKGLPPYKEERTQEQDKGTSSPTLSYVIGFRFLGTCLSPFSGSKALLIDRRLRGKSLFSVSGIPNWYLFCSDLDRQPPSIQQHHENPHSEQQHGWPDMDPRHHLPKLQDCRGSLDHHTQPAPQNLEWWENPVHVTVRCYLALFWVFKTGFIDGI